MLKHWENFISRHSLISKGIQRNKLLVILVSVMIFGSRISLSITLSRVV